MRRTRFGALLMAAGLLVGACTTGASPTPAATPAPTGAATPAPTTAPETPKAGGTLIVALPGDISRTDSALIDDSNSSYVMNQVMEGLVGLQPGSASEVIPVLAESWTISEDALTYTFKLRQGIKFHDGTAFDAAAVKFNYDRWLNIPDAYSKLEYTYYIDVALKPVVDSVTVNSPTEVAIKLKAPNSAFLTTQTLTPFFISSPTALALGKANDPDFANNTYAQGGAGAMTGTGPFKFKEWVPGDHVTLVKNADYWDTAHAAYLDGIKFQTNFADSTATLNALQSGGIDFAQTLSPIDGKTVEGDATLQAIDRGGSCNLFNLSINQTHKPFDNLKIRQAVAYAVNKQAIIDTFYAGQAVVADNWMPPGFFSYKALNLPTYEPEKAKALIAESGVTDLSFDFWYPSDVARPYMPDPKGEFEAILRDLEAVGFKPNPKTATWRPDYLSAESGGNYPLWLIGWTCDWAGPDNFLSTAFFGYRARSDNTFGPNEEFGYKNDAMWQAMDNALKTNSLDKAKEYWQQAQDLIAADMPSVPMLSSKPPAAAQLYVKGFVPNSTLTELFNTVWLADH